MKKRSLIDVTFRKTLDHLTDWWTIRLGKTSVAKQLGRRFETSWLQVDDLRLALQRSRVILPERTEDLYFFEETPEVWSMPSERLCDGLIALGNVISPAIEVVTENHVDTSDPVVIEGDGILPSLMTRPSVRERASKGRVEVVFLVESEEDVLLAGMDVRYRAIARQNKAQLRSMAHTRWIHGQWLANEARCYGLPVLEPRPKETLVNGLWRQLM